MSNKAIIVGASGLIGSTLLDILLQQPDYDEVLIFVRSVLPLTHPKLRQLVVNFDELDRYSDEVNGHAIFCCLGTTRKKTPDMAVYRKIDHDYPVQMAKLGKANGVEQYHLISAIGANAKSSNFYLKMKGEVEEDVKAVGLESTFIYEPSFIEGERKEYRPSEKIIKSIMKVANLLMLGSWRKYRSIHAHTIAMAMYKQSIKKQPGVFTYTFDQITKLA